MRRRSRVRPLLACVAMAAGVAVSWSGANAASAATPVQSGMSVLAASINQSGRGWGDAVALTTMETYRQATGDTSYDALIATTYDNGAGTHFENDYLDDTGWWALAWTKAYDITGDTRYLTMAQHEADYMHSFWDGTCNGGVWWSTARTYKNAITNELFLQVTAGLHNRLPGDTKYADWANAEWRWFAASGLINGNNLVNDGLTSSCANNGSKAWSYNQGVILAGLAELAKANHDDSLLARAKQIADAATTRLTVNGVLTEGCEPSCGSDGENFKGIFVGSLRTYADAAHTTAYDAFFTRQGQSIQANDTTSAGQFGVAWAGPPAALGLSSQASAESALIAALGPLPYGAVGSGIAGKCMDVKFGSNVSGTAVQLWSCNGNPSQMWTWSPDGRLRALGKCLDATSATTNGTKLQLWDCNNSGAQLWQPSNGGYRNTGSGRCLDDPAGTTNDGSQLQLWDCNGSAAQKWSLPGALTAGVTPPPATSVTLQAENASAQSGTGTEATSDVGGGSNVGWIGNGDWLRFDNVSFGTSGLSNVTLRAASGAAAGVSGTVQVRLDSVTAAPVGSASVGSTGGWQVWRDVPATTTAITGTHTVYVTFATGSGQDFMNLNWLSVR